MNLYLSRVHFPVTTLGPGKRIGIWFQGCSIRCPGCISVDTWALHKNGISLDNLITEIMPWLEHAEGITISGGEPFDQPEALFSLLTLLKLKTNNDILVYSGYEYEKIVHTVTKCDGLIDVLISDPYVMGESQSLALRGSDNQRMHFLTSLGKERFQSHEEYQHKTLDVMFDPDGTVWFAGIPKHNDMLRLKQILSNEGHQIITTDDNKRIHGEIL